MRWKPVIYKALAETIQEVFKPSSVIDVGCGNGILSTGFTASYSGLEGSYAGWQTCIRHELRVQQADLRGPFNPVVHFDLAVSIEVAEHIEGEYAEEFVSTLCKLSDIVILTASNKPGPTHVNCQPKSYWIEKFRAKGYEAHPLESTLVDKIKEIVPDDKAYLYNNMMVFGHE